jgi:ribosomal protein L37E
VVKNGVEALGKIWHREHFVCQHCEDPLNPEGKICQAEGYSSSSLAPLFLIAGIH